MALLGEVLPPIVNGVENNPSLTSMADIVSSKKLRSRFRRGDPAAYGGSYHVVVALGPYRVEATCDDHEIYSKLAVME